MDPGLESQDPQEVFHLDKDVVESGPAAAVHQLKETVDGRVLLRKPLLQK
jgi:hypothetical protein